MFPCFRKIIKYHHPNGCAQGMVYVFVDFFLGGVGYLCLQISLSVPWLGVMFTSGFVCFWVGGYMIAK